MLVGYMRVSKADGSQTLELQRDALLAAGVDTARLYDDHASGRSDDRPDPRSFSRRPHRRPRPRILLGLCWPYPLRFGVLLMIVVVGIDRGGASRRDALTAGRSERCSRSGESDGAEMLSSVARASSGGREVAGRGLA